MPATAPTASTRYTTRLIVATASAVLCLTVWACYAVQPDPLAALTYWPPWVWAFPGLVLVLPQLRRPPRRAAILAALLWVIYLVVFQEELGSLLRRPALSAQAFDEARSHGEAIRVVSANCAGGQASVAAEAADLGPDILVLEESPPARAVAELATDLFGEAGHLARGPDVAIIARGEVDHLPRKGAWYLTAARVRLASGASVSVIGAHLTPPVFGLDLLSPDHWRAQERNRKIRRGQTQELARLTAQLAQGGPVIVAGDLNCPAGDATLRPLSPILHDAFREAGVGWGNTVLNEFPVMRFDQVWCSDELRPVHVRAVRSRTSDHRLVIADFIVPQPPAG